ncbi:MAG: aKG-HExxH-type peptide beta-hydroxylase [Endozoicomonas sp.]|uniref:aKG-HExxH-type peptide beta-hydroxylase n=1 Tax=Endozoicomonas sp. TaxID=1892382 RepID=UPI003D9BEA8D
MFLSVSHSRENIENLAKAVLQDEYDSNEQLKFSYSKSIEKIRGIECNHDIKVQFHSSPIAREAIRQGVFSEAADLDDKITIQSESYQMHCLNLYNEAIKLIEKNSIQLLQLIELVTTDVVFVHSPRIGGGTGSHLPGVICISIGDDWTEVDVANTLVHEATHLNVFLCDMVNKVFTSPASELDKEEYRVLSAVRVGDMRPLDKAVHSAFVTVPLLYFEKLLGSCEMMKEFSVSLNDCVNGVVEKEFLFTQYGQQLVNQLREFNESRDFSLVEKALI